MSYVGEMILGQHGVSRVGGVVVLKDNMLLGLAALDDLSSSGGKLILDLIKDGDDEGGNDGEDPERKLLLKLLDDLAEEGDLLNSRRDGLEKVVVELNGRSDLGKHVVDVDCELLRVPGRDGGILHLSGLGVVLNLVHFVLLVASNDAIGDLIQEVAEKAGVIVLVVLEGALEIVQLALGQLVRDFSSDRVQEIDTAKGAGDDGVDLVASALEPNLGVATNVREDITLAHLGERELDVVAVGEVVLQAVQTSSQETKGLVEILVVLVSPVAAAELDAFPKELANMQRRGHDVDILIRNVILHARLGVDAELDLLVHGAAQTTVVLRRIFVIGIVLGVVDVVLGAVAAQTVGRDLELAAAIAKGEEAEDAEEQTDGLSRDALDRADVDGLGVVAEPVAKVDAGDHDLVKLLATNRAGHHDLEESIFDIAVAPVLALDTRDAGNVTSSESKSGLGKVVQHNESEEEGEWLDASHDCGFSG